jgi:IS1 transposase
VGGYGERKLPPTTSSASEPADQLASVSWVIFRGVIPPAQHKATTKRARNTHHVERFNNTLRERVPRLVRDTLSFSNKLTNHIGAIKYCICHDNLTKTPA